MLLRSIRKNYKAINVTLLLLSIYVLTYPLWSFLLSKISPQLTRCVYLQVTNHPCPFCGSTRYIKSIWLNGITFEALWDFKSVIVGFMIFNIIFRCRNIICKYNKINRIVIFDTCLIMFMLILLVIYIIVFFKS